MSRYGVPCKGSKNGIANWIIDMLPTGDTLVDLFCGGCAVTHAALLSGKWEHFIANDIDGRMPQFFIDAIHGKYTTENHKEWISREEFHANKVADIYTAIVWSFGNNGVDYLYARENEPIKHALHMAVMFDDVTELQQWFDVEKSGLPTVKERMSYYRKKRKKDYQFPFAARLESAERLQVFERLQALEQLQGLYNLCAVEGLQTLKGSCSTLCGISIYGKPYDEVDIPKGTVIYCDPPYKGTNCGRYDGFDSDRFHEWAREQDNIFISEYQMPDDFICLQDKQKMVLSTSKGAGHTTERLYTNQRTWKQLSDSYKERIGQYQQLTLDL